NSLIPPDSGLILDTATAINNAGQIVGIACRTDGPCTGVEQHAFLLTPDKGAVPRGLDSSAFGMLASPQEVARIEQITNRQPANVLREPAPADSQAVMPAGLTVRQAKDAVFANSHRSQAGRAEREPGNELTPLHSVDNLCA